MTKTIVTHDSSFHIDDVFAVATAILAYPTLKIKVIRSREQVDIDKGDLVIDVGGISNPLEGKFDHHQREGAGKRENGIPYASFGLVWKHFGEKICGSKEIQNRIDIKLVAGIDAVDNGVEVYAPIFEDAYPYGVADYFYSFKTSNEEGADLLYKTFMELVSLAKDLLTREIEYEKRGEILREEIENAYNLSKKREIIIVEKSYQRPLFCEVLSRFPEPLYFVYPKTDGGGWKVEAIPQSFHGMSSRKPLPASWVGLRGEELAKVTGVPDSVFCHRGGFMAVAKSKEGAIALAKIALES